jgi:hypothetical protein
MRRRLRLGRLSRPGTAIGVMSVVAGVGAFLSAYLAWYEVAATVDMLGASSARPVATLAGWQAHPWGWLVPVFALVSIAVGVLLVMDRPPTRTRDLLAACGLGLGSVVALGGLLFPPVSRFDVAGSRLRELGDLAGRLPTDVDLTFAVRPGIGLWVTLAAGVLVLLASLASRRLF